MCGCGENKECLCDNELVTISACTKEIVIGTELAEGELVLWSYTIGYGKHCGGSFVGCNGEVIVPVEDLLTPFQKIEIFLEHKGNQINLFNEKCVLSCSAIMEVVKGCNGDKFIYSSCFRSATVKHSWKENICKHTCKLASCKHKDKDMKRISVNGTFFDLPSSTVLVAGVATLNPDLLPFLQSIAPNVSFNVTFDPLLGLTEITSIGDDLIEIYGSCGKIERVCL